MTSSLTVRGRQQSSLPPRRTWSRGSRQKFYELDNLYKPLQNKAEDRLRALKLIHDTLATLFTPFEPGKEGKDVLPFPDRCEQAAESMSDQTINLSAEYQQAEGPAVCKLLKARLYLRASQNGARIGWANQAQPQLAEGLKLVEPPQGYPKDDLLTHLHIAYLHYLGIVSKLQAQHYKAYEAVVGKKEAEDRATLLKKAFNYYTQAEKEADEAKLAVAKARAHGNLMDWWLLLHAIALEKEDPATPLQRDNLPVAAITIFKNIRDHPEKQVKHLEEKVDELKRGFSERPSAISLVTTAQAECLLALACQRKADPGGDWQKPKAPCDEALRHCHTALAYLKIAWPVFDEKEIFDQKRLHDYHLGPLVDFEGPHQKEFKNLPPG